jgi:hypothetical protein
VLNLAQAFQYSYNEETSSLTVWWAFPLPFEQTSEALAPLYDDGSRLSYHYVLKLEWLRFLRVNCIDYLEEKL